MEKKSKSEQAKDDWMNTKWRPAMGWMYMGVCIFDFVLAPVLWSVIQFWETQAANDAFRQWQPMTLQGAGLFHMAMGAVLGVAAWSRGQEKITAMNSGFNNVGTQPAGYTTTGYNNGPAFGMTQQETTYSSQTPINTSTSGTRVPQSPDKEL